jgi:hypothetical protein
VAEIVDGQPKAFPNDECNKPGPAGSHFICVQSLIVDDQDNLWVLDPAAPQMQEIVKGGPKLVKIDLATDQVVQTIPFGEDVAPKKSYLHDVRIDGERLACGKRFENETFNRHDRENRRHSCLSRMHHSIRHRRRLAGVLVYSAIVLGVANYRCNVNVAPNKQNPLTKIVRR